MKLGLIQHIDFRNRPQHKALLDVIKFFGSSAESVGENDYERVRCNIECAAKSVVGLSHWAQHRSEARSEGSATARDTHRRNFGLEL